MVFVLCTSGLAALKVDEAAPSFSVAWRSGQRANSPIVAYGLVWSVTTTEGFRQDWTGTLVGFNALTGAIQASTGLGPIPHFASPAAVGGSLYIGGRGTRVRGERRLAAALEGG
jgi:hypothetical protein